jgi:hypothetical protein
LNRMSSVSVMFFFVFCKDKCLYIKVLNGAKALLD